MNNKIPVYYHIPKCGGTFLVNFFSVYAYVYYKKILKINQDKNYQLMILNNEEEVIARVYTSRKNMDGTTHATENIFKTNIETYLKNKDSQDNICCIVVEPRFDCWLNVKKVLMTDRPLNNFTILRSPFSRMCSLFNYLNSKNSSHERMHKKVPEEFEEYIKSYNYEDSFIIRKLVEINTNKKINEDNYLKAISCISDMNMTLKDISQIEQVLMNVFKECYGLEINMDKLKEKRKSEIEGFFNKTDYKSKLSLETLSEEAQKFFKERTKYDQIFYDYYIV